MEEFESKKLETLYEYYVGNLVYTSFLFEMCYEENGKSKKDIVKTEFLNSVTVSLISVIFQSIKEEIIINKGDLVYESNLLLSKLESNVELIIEKNKNRYIIDNKEFTTAADVVVFIRNKLAHGMFYIEDNNVYLLDGENLVKININKLKNFIMNSLYSLYKDKIDTIYKRNIIINDKVNTSRKKKVNTKSEMIGLIKSFKCIEVSLSSIDNKTISVSMNKIYRDYLHLYNNTGDIKYLYNLDIICKSMGYKFEYKYVPIKNIDYNELADNLLKMTKDDITYIEMVKYTGYKLSLITNANKKYNTLLSHLNNMILIDNIKNHKSSDVLGFINETYDSFSISYNEITSSLICMFNSLFNYSVDKIFKDDNIYFTNKIDGLDYSMLDLSMFNVNYKEEYNSYMSNILNEKTSIIKKINVVRENINKNNININNVSSTNNLTVINKLNVIRNELLNNEQILLSELSKRDNIINNYNNNYKYFYNYSIIEGIRNSIAHGNYFVSDISNFENAIITFKDIYNDKLTLEVNIKLCDFYTFMINNHDYIFNYIRLKEEKNKTLIR